jgi:hypothetical protein
MAVSRPSKAKKSREADRALERLGYRRVEADPVERLSDRRVDELDKPVKVAGRPRREG